MVMDRLVQPSNFTSILDGLGGIIQFSLTLLPAVQIIDIVIIFLKPGGYFMHIERFHILQTDTVCLLHGTDCIYVFCVDLRTNSD
jgi:hypothetical protein